MKANNAIAGLALFLDQPSQNSIDHGNEHLSTITTTPKVENERNAKRLLNETTDRPGCQCHRCKWAHNVLAGIEKRSFEESR